MVFSRICVNNNGDSSSFLDDSEEMMDATKRIVCCCSQAFMSIFSSASIGIAVDVFMIHISEFIMRLTFLLEILSVEG
ncbi:Uroporphyrinogen decarboxylase [Trichinella pseudospiralis]